MAFSGCELLESVTIDCEIIGDYMFSSCSNLKEIRFSPNIESIAKGAFSSCSSLEKINWPQNITRIEDSAFSYCSGLKEIRLPQNITYVGGGAFSGYYSDRTIYVEKTSEEMLNWGNYWHEANHVVYKGGEMYASAS